MSKQGAQHIWALVSGLPSGKRERRLLLMLQAYMDESYSYGPDVYAVAGFVSTADRWAAFSTEWQQVLEMKPRIRYFKMSEAMGFNGEFRGWSEKARDEKLSLLQGVLGDHAILGVGGVLQQDVYKRVFGQDGELPKPLTRPYFFLLHGVIGELAAHQHEYPELSEKIDFIFDEMLGEKAAVIDGWELFRLSTRAPDHFIGSVPTFRNDQEYLPLQAADMHAWILRENARRNLLRQPWVKVPPRIKGKRNPPTHIFAWNEEGLREIRREMDEYWFWVRPSFRASIPAWDSAWVPAWEWSRS